MYEPVFNGIKQKRKIKTNDQLTSWRKKNDPIHQKDKDRMDGLVTYGRPMII